MEPASPSPVSCRTGLRRNYGDLESVCSSFVACVSSVCVCASAQVFVEYVQPVWLLPVDPVSKYGFVVGERSSQRVLCRHGQQVSPAVGVSGSQLSLLVFSGAACFRFCQQTDRLDARLGPAPARLTSQRSEAEAVALDQLRVGRALRPLQASDGYAICVCGVRVRQASRVQRSTHGAVHPEGHPSVERQPSGNDLQHAAVVGSKPRQVRVSQEDVTEQRAAGIYQRGWIAAHC